MARIAVGCGLDVPKRLARRADAVVAVAAAARERDELAAGVTALARKGSVCAVKRKSRREMVE
jgi:hypothetical protein